MDAINKKARIKSEPIAEIPVNEKSCIRISKTMREGENIMCVDIRTFQLYPIKGHYDGEKKATPHGVPFTLDKLPDVINALIGIYEEEYGASFVPNNTHVNEDNDWVNGNE